MPIIHDSFSYPPRGLSRTEAARWVGVGATKFDEMVADGRMPRPHRIDARVVWDRHKLDISFADLPQEGHRGKPKNRIDELLGTGSAA